MTTSTGADTLPVWTTLGDINGDGIQDLVTSLYLTDSVSVQLGKGDGTFQTAKTILIAAGFGPSECHLVSLRGNGRLDLIVGQFNTNQIAVLLGKGDGTFENPVFYTVGTSNNTPTSLTIGDFNDDSNLDVAVANTETTPSASSWFSVDSRRWARPSTLDILPRPSVQVTSTGTVIPTWPSQITVTEQ